MTTVDQALQRARSQGVARLDALLLLGHVTGLARTELIAHGDRVLDEAQARTLGELLARRADSVPMAYLLGRHEFHGLMLQVTPAVLDPRPDTETLVDWALELMEASSVGGADRGAGSGTPPRRALDLGTGSGAIALALKAARPDWEVHACDASPPALEVARGNALALGLPLHLHEGSWWTALHDPPPLGGPGLRFDVAVGNPPYLAPDDPHLQALRHEPHQALVAADAGLADLHAIIDGAAAHLNPGAWLLLEHGHDQAAAVAQRLKAAGFEGVAHRRDLAGHTRCTGGRLAR